MTLTPAREDYLVIIYLLTQTQATVRAVDVAKALGHAKPTVSQSLRLLKANGLVASDSGQALYLTPQGTAKAQKIYSRYQTTAAFLAHILQVSPATACQDACQIEHLLSNETQQKMQTYLLQRFPQA